MKKYFFAAALATATIFSACDPCKDVECQNSGTCVEGTCECATGYEGVNCETEMRTKFLGNYKVSGSDTGGFTYTDVPVKIETTSSSTSGTVLTFTVNGTQWTGKVTNSTTITLDPKETANVEKLNSGTITISGTTITVKTEMTDLSVTPSVNYSLTLSGAKL